MIKRFMKISQKTKETEPEEEITKQPDNSQLNIEEKPEVEEDFPELPGDFFHINASGHFDEEDILEIEMPKFVLKNSVKGVQEVDERSNLTIVFRHDESNPDLGKRIFKAIKDGFKKFEIYFVDADEEISSVWEFEGIKIRGVDFGNLMHTRKEPRTIQCELEYEHFSIDNEVIS